MRRRWQAVVEIGVFWVGPSFVLTTGPRWWCDLRARVYLFNHPWRRVHIKPA